MDVMFGLFKRKRKEKSSVVYGLMNKVGAFVERKQRRAADYLNRKVAGCSRKQLKAGLIFFCLSFGSTAVYVVYNSFSGGATTVRVESIHVPESAVLPKRNDSIVTLAAPKAIVKIRAFRRYLDSLQQTREGKFIYDSIVRLRPGLSDSLDMTLELYEEQIKTK
jgi:hypothetical protein